MPRTNSLAVSFGSAVTRPARTPAGLQRSSEQAFLAVSVLLFVFSTTVTVRWCNSMSAMEGMPMPGGWTMSMTWMRMPGQTWIEATAAFLGMWVVMMAAMMLPSLVLMLRRFRNSVSTTHEKQLNQLTALAGLGYFFVWTLLGFAVFPLGVAIAALEMQRPTMARAVPVVTGVVVLIAGVVQFSRWKAHHLASCREAPGRNCVLPPHAVAAWRLGLHFGFHCAISCANLTAILLALGVMDTRAMAAVTVAITAERIAPGGKHVARIIGALVIGVGVLLILRAVRSA